MKNDSGTDGAGRFAAWMDGEIARLSPGYFAVVMATGIVSNALFLENHHVLSGALLAVNIVAYSALCLLNLTRAYRFPRALGKDASDPRSVFSFFTFVAASDVLGLGLLLRGFGGVAIVLWALALLVWMVMTYVGFAVLAFRNTARGADVAQGAWLIAIVGTQSLVVLGAAIAPQQGAFAPSLFLLIHALWGIGLCLYGIFIVLFCRRVFFLDVVPEDLTPVLWIVMGAAAISVNAGSALLLADSGMTFLSVMRPFLAGITFVLWAWATWWIPLLVLFGLWKHGVHRVPLRYTPLLWSLVFPLGMYAAASLRLSWVTDFAPLQRVADTMVWVALAAWGATAYGLLSSIRMGRTRDLTA